MGATPSAPPPLFPCPELPVACRAAPPGKPDADLRRPPTRPASPGSSRGHDRDLRAHPGDPGESDRPAGQPAREPAAARGADPPARPEPTRLHAVLGLHKAAPPRRPRYAVQPEPLGAQRRPLAVRRCLRADALREAP